MTYDAIVTLDAHLDAGVRNGDSECEHDIELLLDKLTELQALQACMALNKQELVDAVLTPEIRQKIADIDAEYAPREDDVNTRIGQVSGAVKTAVVTYGKTVSGDHLQAVYVKGRVTWDTKAIDGYAMNHPELFTFRKEGEPSVSIRKR